MFGWGKSVIRRDTDGVPRHDDIGPAAAYRLGRAQVQAGGRLGGRKVGAFFLLPLAVGKLPGGDRDYEALDPLERKAVDWLYRVLLPLPINEVGYPQPNGPNMVASLGFNFVRKQGMDWHSRQDADGWGDLAAEFLKEAIAEFEAKALPEYDLTTATGIAAMKASGDPEILHHAAVTFMAYLDDQDGVLAWLAEAPALDRGTAGWLLIHAGLDGRLAGNDGWYHSVLGDDQVEEAVRALCRRSEQTGFDNDAIGLDGDPAAILAAHEAHGMPDGIPWPAAIFGKPFAAFDPGAMRYRDTGDEGRIVPV